MDATHPGAAMLKPRSLFQRNRFAKCAIETALFGAQAQRLGVRLSELFGGHVRDSVEVARTLASRNTQRDIDEPIQMFEARRHRAFKLKIGGHAGDDVAHVLAVDAALGERGEVRVDVNRTWSESEAIWACA
jgi:muconate cycloisomerase